MTDGGEGCPGRKRSKESIEKFKKSMSKNPHPMLGKTHTPEAREKISKAGIGRVKSPETIEKLKKAHTGKVPTEKQLQALLRTGITPANAYKVINIKTKKVYNSVVDASKDYKNSKNSLLRRLQGEYFNDTDFIFLKEYKEII